MEILKRAESGGEIVEWKENPETVCEEVMRRNTKAGYFGAGKGDSYRPVNKKRYDENYERIYHRGTKL